MYWKGSHSKYRFMVHFVWVPKYRKSVLVGKVAKRVEELLYECAEVNGWRIDELNIQKDHVHLLVQLRADVSLSKAVQYFKGGSSRVIRREFPELRAFLWGDSFWADGYFADSVGVINLQTIRNYVRNQ